MSAARPESKPANVRFSAFEVNFDSRELFKYGTRVKLSDQPFEILCMLLERPGEIVSREEMRQRLWPANTYVEYEDSLNTAVRKLRAALSDSSDLPRYVETVARRGYRFIAPVTLVHGRSLLNSEIRFEKTPTSDPLSAKRFSHSRWLSYAALAGLLSALLAGYGFYRVRRHTPGAEETNPMPVVEASLSRRSVAILGFQNLTNSAGEAWLSTALSEMLGTELAAGNGLRVVPAEDVARVRFELPVVNIDGFSKDTLGRIHTNLDADFVVLGSFAVIANRNTQKIRVDLRLQDAAAGRTRVEIAETGEGSDLFKLVSRLGGRLRAELGVIGEDDTQNRSRQLRASFPQNQEAARLYAEGLESLRSYDFLHARDLLLKAGDLDPRFPLIHSALAEAWKTLGYDGRARAEAKRASELSGKLPREERFFVRARYFEITGQWQKAVDVYKSLLVFLPDDFDYGLHLANAQCWAGTISDGLATLASLRRRTPPASDTRLDLEEANAFHLKEDWKNLQYAAFRAGQKARVRGERLLLARARAYEGIGLMYLGDNDAAMSAFQEAKSIYSEAGNRYLVAKVLNDCAVLRARQGNLEAAKLIWNETLTNFREMGNQEGVATIANNLANVVGQQGDLDAALSLTRKALEGFRASGDSEGIALATYVMGMTLVEKADLTGANAAFQRALFVSRQIDDKSVTAFSVNDLGVIALFKDDLTAAKTNFDQAFGLRQQIGEKQSLAETEVRQGELALEKEQADVAEKLTRNAKTEFHAENDFDDEILADAVLIRSLLAQHKLGETQALVDDATALLQKSSDIRSRFTVGIALGQVLAISGRSKEAVDKLLTTAIEASKAGFTNYAMEARLVLGRVQLQSGDSSSGRQTLSEVHRDASAKGFFLIARKARAALNKQPVAKVAAIGRSQPRAPALRGPRWSV